MKKISTPSSYSSRKVRVKPKPVILKAKKEDKSIREQRPEGESGNSLGEYKLDLMKLE